MCGVCGIASLFSPLDIKLASRRIGVMVNALAHRGPDESGTETDTFAVLGATRLAIRGLHSGRQPMVDPATGVTVVCNGEIDNHQELRRWLEARGRPVRSATDIAVIPGLYLELGEAFPERLVGEFAIGIWDPRRACVILARDRAGERPLFFTNQNNLVRFATEIAALTADESLAFRIDHDAVRGYLRSGCFAAPRTPFHEIEKIAPAEIACIDATGVRRRRYWQWTPGQASKSPPTLTAFATVFEEAVRRQGDVDVPYGLFLSGGLDSSLIAAVDRKVRPDHRPRAYTLRFRDASYDEGDFAIQVARQLNIEIDPVWVEPESFMVEIGKLVRLVGEPLADPAWVPTALLARRAVQDVKVALVGEGGDELFGGYPTYLGALWAERYAGLPGPIRALAERAIKAWPPSDKKVALSFLLKKFVQGAAMDGGQRHLLWTAAIPPAMLARLGLASEPSALGPSLLDAQQRVPTTAGSPTPGHLLDLLQQYDLTTTLAEGLLTKADRASMSSALELRAPFLDQAVMEFAATLPVPERVQGMTTKVFLKRFAEQYLPRTIVRRRKRGLSVPLAQWLRGPLRDWATAHVRSDRLAEFGVQRAAAQEILDEHCQHRADHARVLWTLIVLDEWLAVADSRSE